MLRQWAYPPTHLTRRPIIRIHPVHHLSSQRYATVGQKTWRNSDEVVTKLGLFPDRWALRSVRRQLGVALEPVCWLRDLKRNRSPGECSSLEWRLPLSIIVMFV